MLHKFHIGYFIDFKNIYIIDGNIVKVRDFTTAFSVACWDETKQGINYKEGMYMYDKRYIMPTYRDFVNVCGYSLKKSMAEDVQKDRMTMNIGKMDDEYDR